MCIQVQQITYIHPDKEVLFRNLSFTVGKGRQLALIGNNGCGKSTLLQIMAATVAITFTKSGIVCAMNPSIFSIF